ncbi:MAG: metal-dependent transcriptional regulator [Verrucomicrobia bacterium]|nr:MAG: metal-dependent transcriptional regulator [Verrucomicrobiota bacterium]
MMLNASPTQEDYLEVILRLLDQRGNARVRDIAHELAVHKSTVSAALRVLAAKNLVSYAPYEAVSLTPDGRNVAEAVLRRHAMIKKFLVEVLAVPEDSAEATACRLEHHVGPAVVQRIEAFLSFVHRSPSGRRIHSEFRRYLRKKGKAS